LDNPQLFNLHDYIINDYGERGPLIYKDLTQNEWVQWVNEKRDNVDIWTYGFRENLEGFESDTFLQDTQNLYTVVLINLNTTKENSSENENIYTQILATFRFVDDAVPKKEGDFPWSSSEIVRVGFLLGTNLDPPQSALPINLQNSVAGMRKQFSLSDEEIDRIGAGWTRLWFEIALKQDIDTADFLEELQAQANVESAYVVPDPPPPP
jgi:hypothetical protein